MDLLKKVFLADDDQDDQELFQHALKEIDSSITCEIARNGFETIEMLKGRKVLPDVIFLDLNMPLMNGFECLSKLKNDALLSMLPVVIFTTTKNPVEVQATHQLGANVFLTKPSTKQELRSKLERILRIDFKTGIGAFKQYSV